MTFAKRPRAKRERLHDDGETAERAVATWLEARGWSISARRLRLGRLEIDLLARRGDVVAIVEVRSRQAGTLVDPFDTISATKRANLVRAAHRLWAERYADDSTVRVLRIDLAAVVWRADGAADIEVIEGAVENS